PRRRIAFGAGLVFRNGRTRACAPGRAHLFAALLAAVCIVSSRAHAQLDQSLEAALALAQNPPAVDVRGLESPTEDAVAGSGNPVNLLIAVHKTATQRYSDTYLTSGKKRGRPIVTSMRLRRQD